MAGTSDPQPGVHAEPSPEPSLRYPADGFVSATWETHGVVLGPREGQEATTVQHVIDQVVDENRKVLEMVAASELAPGSQLFQQTMQELRMKSPPAPTTSSDETMPSAPERATVVRRKKSIASRRLSRPNVQGSTTPTSSSSNNTSSCPTGATLVRSQHALSHVRTNRLTTKTNPPGKADVAIHRKQLRTIELARTRRLHNRCAQNPELLAAAIRSETHLLDGEPGWDRDDLPETTPLPTGFVITPSSYNSLWDEEPRIAPPISWKTLHEARQKCTEWLVQHVLLPDPAPPRSRARIRSQRSCDH